MYKVTGAQIHHQIKIVITHGTSTSSKPNMKMIETVFFVGITANGFFNHHICNIRSYINQAGHRFVIIFNKYMACIKYFLNLTNLE